MEGSENQAAEHLLFDDFSTVTSQAEFFDEKDAVIDENDDSNDVQKMIF